jgi:hypothetical protein
MVSEKHANFLINTGNATAADLEALGEEVRRRVYETSGILLEWEIERIGLAAPAIVARGIWEPSSAAARFPSARFAPTPPSPACGGGLGRGKAWDEGPGAAIGYERGI